MEPLTIGIIAIAAVTVAYFLSNIDYSKPARRKAQQKLLDDQDARYMARRR